MHLQQAHSVRKTRNTVIYGGIPFREQAANLKLRERMTEPKIWLGNDGIMREEYTQKISITMDKSKEIRARKLAVSGGRHPLLIHLLHGLGDFEYSSTQLLGSDKEGEITSAVAIVLSLPTEYPILTKLYVERFERHLKHRFPVKVFDEESDAVEWLKQYA